MTETIAQDRHGTTPPMMRDCDFFDEGTYIWDASPIRTPDEAAAVIDGWVVLVGLMPTAPRWSDL